ncbi:hypothetical protein CHH90_08895 [Bacillus licheniformis]|nr:hypothetical protein AB684_04880 [Bacillus licheniformis]APJ26162.1 hypothetical protein BSZ43_04860 [Bacillus sp. H15-1]ASV14512.1 hypothetical protein CJO35_04890 [Bacillus sp. 1s-1]EQM29122.1 hypothetical protein N399_05125 [Bacillus licheniformis CG-B52]KUL09629.1 hypothetical protein LI17339_14020 [Bacillus licheniformis LMG 17339]MBY8349475.1 hypothetical protein [Bacillus sp. PCH94]NBB43365.1 hypothetical protein [Bacillus sp. y1(2019)]
MSAQKIFGYQKIIRDISLLIYDAYGLFEALFIKSGLFQKVQRFWSISLNADFKFHDEQPERRRRTSLFNRA